MTAKVLEPDFSLLSQEYVLIQAWKKTASYIRYHNWYSDTLELDRAATDLPHFLAELAEQLEVPGQWENDPLRIVFAPKNQPWHIDQESKQWVPSEPNNTEKRLRPLAHVSLKDQIAATAVSLCLANRVETLQGDPTAPIKQYNNTVSYGNRLLCDARDEELQHRWGTQKLYRSYFQDYQCFLLRSDLVAMEIREEEGDEKIIVVHSDLHRFYDTVKPELLASKIKSVRTATDDPRFYEFTDRLLNWSWDRRDLREVTHYAEQADIRNFSQVSLPQGLVTAGFFSNIVLLDFDQALRSATSTEIEPGIRIEDACRYVDDMRLVLTVSNNASLEEIKQIIVNWIEELLDTHAAGLSPSKDKTIAMELGGDEQPLLHQSSKMARIQHAVSGGFDVARGEMILDSVQGLINAQKRHSETESNLSGWSFSPRSDVGDATIARFAAGRFRSTYRSLRPLLRDRDHSTKSETDSPSSTNVARTQADLDDEAQAFALSLIEAWVLDPSNVRLLRIGLDLWPAENVLKSILDLLRPFTEDNGIENAPRRVAWYSLSEIFRAGATETGFTENGESLPAEIDIDEYRDALTSEAIRVTSLPLKQSPWYLTQQALLFLAATDPSKALALESRTMPETQHYHELLRFLNGNLKDINGRKFSLWAILARRSFLNESQATKLIGPRISVRGLSYIAQRDPSFGMEILNARPELAHGLPPRLRDDLCLKVPRRKDGLSSLSSIVLENRKDTSFRNELSLLDFALKFLHEWRKTSPSGVITPTNVSLQLTNSKRGFSLVETVTIHSSRVKSTGSLYAVPDWCTPNERWRFHLGFLLRFALSQSQDFTKIVRPPHWREDTNSYRPVESHWNQRIYGMFNNQSAFGEVWLPISEWMEQFLYALLSWPGCSVSEVQIWLNEGIGKVLERIEERLDFLLRLQGDRSEVLMLPLTAQRPWGGVGNRPIRGCVVQTVIPNEGTFSENKGDISLSSGNVRKEHRNHLAAALGAIEKMLELRETHKEHDGRLDWLILPELSVHPDDVQTHLVPFSRKHKTIILAGLTFQKLSVDPLLINSAYWIIPKRSPSGGSGVQYVMQGKKNLAPAEEKLNFPNPLIAGFRPCQWLVGYEWSQKVADDPLWLTASICYDATDLNLVADLRDHSDIFAIPALNKDVKTFDQMALALHYHMFQMVIVANNGEYGGSNAYIPYKDNLRRQIFHLHGQPQASLAFFELEENEIRKIKSRKKKTPNVRDTRGKKTKNSVWKHPPAGIK